MRRCLVSILRRTTPFLLLPVSTLEELLQAGSPTRSDALLTVTSSTYIDGGSSGREKHEQAVNDRS